MNWLLAFFITSTISLLILVVAYLYMWRGGRQPSMGLWGVGWSVYTLRFLTMAGEILAADPLPWRFVSLAALGLSGFLLWAGTRSFIGRPLPARTYAWGLLPPVWALVVFVPLPVDIRIAAAPIFLYSGMVDFLTALILFRYTRAVGGRRSAWGLSLAYGIWAALKVGRLLVSIEVPYLVIGLLVVNGLALGLAFALIGLSLVEAERNARRRADRLNALAALTGAAGRFLSPSELLTAALEELGRLLEVEGGMAAFLVEEEEGRQGLRPVATRGFSPACWPRDGALPPPGCLCLRAIAEGQLIRLEQGKDGARVSGCDVGLAIPLPARDRVLGVIGAVLPPERWLSEGEQRTLMTLGQQLGTALENAGLVEAMGREVRRLQALTDASRRMIAGLDLGAVMQGIATAARETLGVDRAALYLYGAETKRIEVGYAEGLSQDYLDFIVDNAYYLPGRDVVGGAEMIWIEDAQHAPGDPALQAASRKEGVHSVLVLPLCHRDRLLGTLVFYHDLVRAYGSEDRQFCRALADQAAMVVENALLYREAQRRLEELIALHEIDLQVTSALDLEEVLETIAGQLRYVLNISTLYIGLYDAKRNELHMPFIVDRGERCPPIRLQVSEGGGLAGWAVRSGEPLWVDDMLEERDRLPVEAVQLGDPTRSLVVLPLVVRGKVVGVLSVQSYEPHAFDAGARRLLTGIATQAAIAIENARLYQAEREARELAERLQETAVLINSSLDLREVLELILDQLAQVVPYDSGAIHILEPDATRVIAVRDLPPEEIGRRYPLDQYPYNRRLARGEGPIVIEDVRENGEGWMVVEGLEHVRANIGVSLWVRDGVIGALTIDSHQPGAYTEADARVVEAFAQQAAIAIENARLYGETARRLAQTQVLREVMLAAASTLDFDQVLERAIETLQGAMGVEFLCFALPDEEGEALRLHPSQIGYPTPAEQVRLPVDGSVCGHVYRTGEPMVVGDVREVPYYYEGAPEVRSELAVPVRVGGRVIGVLNVESRHRDAFDEEDLAFYMAIAGQLGIALENARLYQETVRRLAEAQILQEISLAAASTLDFDQVLERAISALGRMLGVEYLNFMLPDEGGKYMVTHPAMLGFVPPPEGVFRFPATACIAGRVYRTGQPALVPDVSQDPDYAVGADDVRSELAVPVKVGDEVAAVLNLESSRPNAFDEGDLAFYTAVAGQLGVALENARLYRREQHRRREAETLYRAAQALTTTLDLREVLDRILTELQQVVPYDSASVQLLQEGRLEIIGGRGFPNLEELLGVTFDPEKEDNPNSDVVRSRAPVILEDAPTAYEKFRREPHAAAGIRAWMGVPLLFGDRLIGMLALNSREPGFYTPEHARLALAFAGQAAIAIENARIYRQLEEQSAKLGRALQELRYLDRLRDEVVQNVSHELRTPVTLIQGYAELLLSGDLGPVLETQRGALEVIRERTAMLSQLIYNLTALRVVPRETLALLPLAVQEPVRHALSSYSRTADRAGIRFEVDLPDDLPLVVGDRGHLRLVFSHLIENAIKFSPDGGLVRVRAWADGRWVCVAVQDRGIGIASEHLSRIFQRFYQVDGSTTRRFGGMGIGLALVWEIVDAHQGRVEVESKPGEGSTFTVVLPRAEEQR